MSDTPNIDELRGLSDRLASLLAAPEPGLFTWREMLFDVVCDIGSFARLPVPDQPARPTAGWLDNG